MDTISEWDELYKNASPIPAAKVLQENLYLLPSQGRALDLACGLAENAFLLAAQGLTVDAWDNSSIAIQRVNDKAKVTDLAVHGEVKDIVKGSLPVMRYDVIVLTHYLQQSISQDVVTALKPGGLLFFQTFTQEKVSNSGPEEQKYRLKPNELRSMFAGLKLIMYREEGCLGDISCGFRNEAMLIAQKCL